MSFSGGTIGAVMMPLLLGPLAIEYGWKTAFIATGALGALWLLIWATIARPPFLPKSAHTTSKMRWPNFGERRVWALMFSYALPAISPGPVLTILSIYLAQRLHLTQGDVNNVVWIPPLTWGIGYFFWGWAADRFAANNARPVGMFLLLTAISLTLGLTTMTTSVPLAIALISLSTFIGGGFQMVALKVGSFAFPREQSALLSGIASGSWSLVTFARYSFASCSTSARTCAPLATLLVTLPHLRAAPFAALQTIPSDFKIPHRACRRQDLRNRYAICNARGRKLTLNWRTHLLTRSLLNVLI